MIPLLLLNFNMRLYGNPTAWYLFLATASTLCNLNDTRARKGDNTGRVDRASKQRNVFPGTGVLCTRSAAAPDDHIDAPHGYHTRDSRCSVLLLLLLFMFTILVCDLGLVVFSENKY